ncbi:MAG TPA: EF-Tu/IF-2/RF-3 family GTPase [Nitrososphaeraceae archaeon]|nr:EF-Tu/IF-2/RF-3 family GTPase [Nitrososphaeraceae archaeon]
MESINFVCLGQTDFVNELGKKGQSSDITTYDSKKDDRIMTYVIPSGFPDKIQPLITAVNLGEYSIVNVDKLDKYLGEQIVALNLLQLDKGFLLHSYGVDSEALGSLLKNTVASSFKVEENVESLKQSINSLSPLKRDGPTIINIDNIFNVKGVGVVVLGIIKQGAIKVHDEITLFPQKKAVTIKSIQMHDKNVDESNSPARVGLALTGVSFDKITRGDILSSHTHLTSADQELIVDFDMVPFYKSELSEKHSYLLSIGTQIKSAKIEKLGNNKLKFLSDGILAFKANDIAILLNPDSRDIRVVGAGRINV